MSPNQILVRNAAGVVVSFALITAVALVLGGPSRQSPVPSARASVRTKPTPAELGARLYETKGCVQCHSIDGSPKVGPSFKGAWGTNVVLGDGVTLVFDEAYVRESLAHPQAKARAGYPPSMPSFDGVLSEREIAALVAFLQALRQPPSTN